MQCQCFRLDLGRGSPRRNGKVIGTYYSYDLGRTSDNPRVLPEAGVKERNCDAWVDRNCGEDVGVCGWEMQAAVLHVGGLAVGEELGVDVWYWEAVEVGVPDNCQVGHIGVAQPANTQSMNIYINVGQKQLQRNKFYKMHTLLITSCIHY